MNKLSKGKNRLTLALCSIALVSGVLAQTANAADDKMISGTICQPNSGAAVSSFSYYSTGIQNNSTSTQSVTCPAVRDSLATAVNVAGANFQGTGTFSCYFDNVNNNGTLGVWRWASRVNTGYLSIISATGPLATIPNTAYAFLCSMPSGGSQVVNLSYVEQ